MPGNSAGLTLGDDITRIAQGLLHGILFGAKGRTQVLQLAGRSSDVGGLKRARPVHPPQFGFHTHS